MIKPTLTFALGFIAALAIGKAYYDPERLRLEGALLAYRSYIYGCQEAGKPASWCKYKADDFWLAIEMIDFKRVP